jgi:hypothetical protein
VLPVALACGQLQTGAAGTLGMISYRYVGLVVR